MLSCALFAMRVRRMKRVEIQPRFEHKKLAKLLGGAKNQRFSRSLNTKVQIWKDRLNSLMKPRLFYRVEEISAAGKGAVRLNEHIAFKSPKLAKSLKNAEKIVCFVGTIGTEVEREIKKLLREHQLAEAYILDALGSVAVESMVDQFQQHMEEKSRRESETVTLRFSPGYCDWPITEQKKLFRVFDPEKMGVELLDSCLMQPRKSISGVFGIAPKGSVPYNPCLDCERSGCEARRHQQATPPSNCAENLH